MLHDKNEMLYLFINKHLTGWHGRSSFLSLLTCELDFILVILQNFQSTGVQEHGFNFERASKAQSQWNQRVQQQNREPRARGLSLKKGLVVRLCGYSYTVTVFLVISAPGAFEIEMKHCCFKPAISAPNSLISVCNEIYIFWQFLKNSNQ